MITDDNTILTQLQTGELDLWADVSEPLADRVRSLPGTKSLTIPVAFTAVAALNLSRPSVSDRRVRQALRYATDSAEILDKVAHHVGVMQESFIPSVVRGYAPLPLARYNITKANSMLDAAGWKRGGDGTRVKEGKPLSIEVAIPAGSQTASLTAELLRESWQRAGVKLDLHAYSSAQFFAPYADGGVLYGGKYDAAIFSTGANIDADQRTNLGCGHNPPNGFNFSHYCNRAVDAAFATYASTFDEKLQATAARTAQQLVDDDVPMIVFYERSFLYTSDTHLQNFHPKAFGTFDDFMNVDN